ncbi:MAG: hypothetical protein B6242_08055 [Anaerolineaceae bacterium 4572_78]|nr:MAG: hypothetical protein B6242_08055 [Anaerolineaceae bacterium 4572_78]
MCRNCLAVGKVTSNSPDPNTALLVEMVGGFFGLMGLGHIYAGRTTDGLIFLIGWLTYLALSWTVIGLLSLVAVGFCLIPAQLLIHIGVPIWLAVKLRNELETQTYQIST